MPFVALLYPNSGRAPWATKTSKAAIIMIDADKRSDGAGFQFKMIPLLRDL
jgi:hypothetical protein